MIATNWAGRSTPYEIERCDDNGNCNFYEVYMTHYHYQEPLKGVSVYQCDTPEEYYGSEDYSYVVIDSNDKEVSIELTEEEEVELLEHFYRFMQF